MTTKYILNDDGEAVEEPDLMKWARWFEHADSVRQTHLDTVGDVRISTIFMALDFNFTPGGLPLLFETMVIGGEHDRHMERCSTRDQAKDQHDEVVRLVKGG